MGELGKEVLDRVAVVTDFVANGSFASLKEHVIYKATPGHAVLIRTLDFNRGWDGQYVWVDQPAYEFLKKSRLVPGDVVISNVGTVGTTFRVPDLGHPMTLGPNAVMLRTRDSQRLNQDFLYYWFRSQRGQAALRSIISGSAQQKFNKTSLRQLTIDCPNIKEQNSIARVLSALDDKIELNRRMNATLEAMARALFQSWFVDFDPVRAKWEGRQPGGMDAETATLFPDSFENSELGPIPKGWVVASVGSIGERVVEGIRDPALWANERLIDLSRLPQKSIAATDWGKGSELTTSVTRFKSDDILFGAIRPYFEKIIVAPFDGVTNTSVFVIRPRIRSNLPLLMLAVCSEGAISHAVQYSKGTKMPVIAWADFSRYRLVIDKNSDVSNKFNSTVEPLLRRVSQNSLESHYLESCRNALIDELLSGKLRVGDLEA